VDAIQSGGFEATLHAIQDSSVHRCPMLADPLALTPAGLVEVVIAFVSAYGALLIWNLPRYRALAHYLLFYQAALMTLNLYEHGRPGLHITQAFTVIKGPLLYLFIRQLVNEKPLRRASLYGQFLPPVVVLLLRASPQLAVMLGSVSQIIYLSLSFRLLHRYHGAAQAFRSDADSLKVNWLTAAYWLIAAQAVIGLIRLNLQPLLNQPPLNQGVLRNWFTIDLLFLLGISCVLIFKALRQPLLYDTMLAYEGAARKLPSKDRELEAAEAKSVFARLETLIVEGELYKKPRLSVDDLAKETGMQMKDISWAFNAGAKTSFNEYINRLRVNAFKQRLQDSNANSGSLLDLAFETGFNSKSSFNATFKREVGKTPSQYLGDVIAERAARSDAVPK
jgi:AraC-like DNA-binding protein